jgi:hypothetical protein
MSFFTETVKINPKMYMKTWKTINNKSNSEQKKSDSITISDFKL